MLNFAEKQSLPCHCAPCLKGRGPRSGEGILCTTTGSLFIIQCVQIFSFNNESPSLGFANPAPARYGGLFILFLCVDARPEINYYLAENSEKKNESEFDVCKKIERDEKRGNARPHQKRNYNVIYAFVKPYRVKYKPDDKA